MVINNSNAVCIPALSFPALSVPVLPILSEELLLIDADPADDEVGDVSRVSVVSAGSLLLLFSFEVLLLVMMVGASTTPCSCIAFIATAFGRFFVADVGVMGDWWLSC